MSSAVGMYDTTVSLPSEIETVVTRRFAAPARHVFDAWTTEAFVREWYGYADFKMTVCDIDLVVGGRWRWVHEMPDGTEIAFSGVYREIVRPTRLVFSEVFEMMPGSDFEVTMTFDETEGVTTLVTHMRYQSQEHRDGHLQSGMEAGTKQVHERLDALFASGQVSNAGRD
jgi:uncharacterized protein YndB with AHSA1/START domain